jgi:drug/metabolite transporter (DMT)-like permease
VARSERFRADLALLGAAVVWGSSFAVQRVAATQVGPFLYTGLRFLLAALALLPLTAERLRRLSRSELWGGALAGSVVFAGSLLQQVGLELTTAGNAGFITGLYVVLVPLFLALIWRQWPHWSVWPASLLAVAGLFLISGMGRLVLAPGDAWELAGAVFWAFHVIIIARFAPRSDALRLAMVQFLSCGLLCTGVGLVVERGTWQAVTAVWPHIAYAGIVSVGIGFTLQVLGLRKAPAADAAIILSMEGAFAGLFGWLMLGEALSPLQLAGCGLILAGMLLAQARTLLQGRRALPRRSQPVGAAPGGPGIACQQE